ncbi:MAG: SDR family oxidoreductase [Gemmataceae bacterium]
MQRELKGKRAILTGASGGIGRAIAECLVKAGTWLALAARNEEGLNALAESLRTLGGDVLVVPTDITKSEERQRLVNMAVEKFGGLDMLVNNAGIGSHGHFSTSTPEIMRQIMEVNFFSPIELTRLAMPHLMQGQQPVVVNVTSMCGRKGMPAWPEYSASKFALVGMSEAWRGEFTRFGVDVVTLVPGLTDSGFRDHMLRADGRVEIRFDQGMTPAELAAGIVEAIRKNRREVVFGSEAKRLLRFNKFFPRLTNWLIARKVTKAYAKQ